MKKLFFAFVLFGLIVSCAPAQKKGAPVIGISSSRIESGRIQLSDNYTQAILRAGGTPLIIPTIDTPEQAETIISLLDGVIFSGGLDLNPQWYGEDVYNETVEIDHVRDRSDSLLARAALASGKPILGICRGEQLMNIILGGSLYQDIPSQCPEAIVHAKGAMHKIAVEKDSFLWKIFQQDTLTVNSFHHQAVKVPAPGIKIAARAVDGTVEAYENDQVWAVQFHPEGLLRKDDAWLPFFLAFLNRF